MSNKSIQEFPIDIFGQLEPYSETLSKGRAKVFYRGLNRNASYITDEFAEKLVATLPYAPIKGIFIDNGANDRDFSDHGAERTQGRAYGVVANPMNFAWERYLDEDGVEREYACVDVVFWTALYSELHEVIGKPLSMELYGPSLEGSWMNVDGNYCYVFTSGSFLGLQILGDEYTPCFEGAQFFSLETAEQVLKAADKCFAKGGQVEHLNFNIPDEVEKKNVEEIFSALNKNYNKDGGWLVDSAVLSAKEDATITFDFATRTFASLEPQKGENGEIICCAKTTATTSPMRLISETTYTQLLELPQTVQTAQEEKAEYRRVIEQKDLEITALKQSVFLLQSFKDGVERDEKLRVIANYEGLLSEDVLDSYKQNLSNFTAVEIDKELTYELKKVAPASFTKTPQYVPKDVPANGLSELLSQPQYRRNRSR